MSVLEEIRLRCTHSGDIPGIIDLCKKVYPDSPPWTENQLQSHLTVFPKGQFVAEEIATNAIKGTASSLIVFWDDYNFKMGWGEFTAKGFFTNHDPAHGRTLYGAEVMVSPDMQGKGIGKRLYQARRDLVRRLGLLRIRAGARLRGYYRYAAEMSAEEYVVKVLRGELGDPTLSFQLKEGFHVLAVVKHYLRHDPESQGWAAVIEWINSDVAKPEDYQGRDPLFIIDKNF